MRRRTACLATVVVALSAPAFARADAGRLVFDGGTAAQRAQVRAALAASRFDFAVVPERVVVHVRRGTESYATPGHVWLDARLLDSGRFAWGVVQHEFAHQVDWFVLGDEDRAAISSLLGGSTWCGGWEAAGHDEHGCERFATAIAWAYWPSPHNVFDPASCRDAAWLRPAAFRLLLQGRLGVRNLFAASTLR